MELDKETVTTVKPGSQIVKSKEILNRRKKFNKTDGYKFFHITIKRYLLLFFSKENKNKK